MKFTPGLEGIHTSSILLWMGHQFCFPYNEPEYNWEKELSALGMGIIDWSPQGHFEVIAVALPAITEPLK